MPNWVKNKVRAINDDDTQKLIAMLVKKNDSTGDYSTNFNGIIPMPEELRTTEDSTSEESRKKMAENKEKYGYRSWYDFSLDNWGCKWDNNNVTIVNDNVIEFETPWAIPDGIYKKIAETIPIIVAYADEAIGCDNCGLLEFNGEEVSDLADEVSGTPTQFANAVWGYEYDCGDDDADPDWYSDQVAYKLNNIIYC